MLLCFFAVIAIVAFAGVIDVAVALAAVVATFVVVVFAATVAGFVIVAVLFRLLLLLQLQLL